MNNIRFRYTYDFMRIFILPIAIGYIFLFINNEDIS